MNRFIRFRQIAWGLCVLGAFSFGSADAQGAGGIQISNSVFREVTVKNPDGGMATKLVPAERAAPGDEMIYEIEYRNAGTDTATEVAIENPLPDEVVFVGAPVPPTAVSVDDGKTFDSLARLTVTGADGRPRAAQPADVTNLRWVVPTVAGGAGGKMTFRVRVK